MRRIGIVLKRGEEQAVLLGEQICRYIKQSGREVLVENSNEEAVRRWKANPTAKIADDSDLLVVLGGDGTILRSASLMNCKLTPVLGINLGRVGFMAEILPQEAIPALEATLAGKAMMVNRMLLQITLPDGTNSRVLNEVVIHWCGLARLIDLGITIGKAREIELRADGLIVSTPIGSSAYSYAANGPLVHPDIEGILLTPVCPYAGLRRPLVIPPKAEISLFLKRGDQFALTLDGHTHMDLKQGQSLRIVKAQLPFVMVKSMARDYIDLMREKLGLV
jgi:NAD+ kinase